MPDGWRWRLPHWYHWRRRDRKRRRGPRHRCLDLNRSRCQLVFPKKLRAAAANKQNQKPQRKKAQPGKHLKRTWDKSKILGKGIRIDEKASLGSTESSLTRYESLGEEEGEKGDFSPPKKGMTNRKKNQKVLVTRKPESITGDQAPTVGEGDFHQQLMWTSASPGKTYKKAASQREREHYDNDFELPQR